MSKRPERIVQQLWMDGLVRHMTDEFSVSQRREMQRGFFAGADMMFIHLFKIGNEKNLSKEHLHEIWTELGEWREGVKREAEALEREIAAMGKAISSVDSDPSPCPSSDAATEPSTPASRSEDRRLRRQRQPEAQSSEPDPSVP